MFNRDPANIYDFETRALVHAVKRNAARFPDGFMFQLSVEATEGMELAIRIEKLEAGHHQPASAIGVIVEEIRWLMKPTKTKRRQIGFVARARCRGDANTDCDRIRRRFRPSS